MGIVANQPKVKGGVLFVDSSDKAASFIWLCNAYNVPLVYLADVAGFMVGTKVEREGIIRHGAKMMFATSQATVPKISVVVRKCYGAGLYAMCGPAFEPDAALSLPQGQIAIMGPEPAVNAVYYNRIMELPEGERAAYVRQKREEYAQDVDVYKLASEMLVDDIVPGSALRAELIKRLAYAESRAAEFPLAAQRRLSRCRSTGSGRPGRVREPPAGAGPRRRSATCYASRLRVSARVSAIVGRQPRAELVVEVAEVVEGGQPLAGVAAQGLAAAGPASRPGRRDRGRRARARSRSASPPRAPAADALDHPLEDAHVLAVAGPEELAVGVPPEPVHAEELRGPGQPAPVASQWAK